MNPFKYIMKYGIRHALEVVYQYKIDILLQNIMSPFYKYKEMQDIIMIESHNDFDCNGGAFYEYLIREGYNLKYKIVWLLKHPNRKPENLPINVECYPLYKPSIKKNYYIWNAKYFFADNTVTAKKRKEQKSVYLTHGVGSLKSVRGKMYMDDSLDFILTASKNFAPIMAKQIGERYPSSRMVSIGFPAHDLMYRGDWGEISKISKNSYKKKILWMPTFRKGGGYRRIDSTMKMELGIPLLHTIDEYFELNNYLFDNNILLIIKIHPMQDISDLSITDLSNICVLTGESAKDKNIDNYKLVSEVDALISDYSSIATEYLHMDRPLGYVFEDEEQFTVGFCVDNIDEFLAGAKLMCLKDLYCFLNNVMEGVDEFAYKRKQLREWIFDYFDGNSCQRLAEFMEL